MDEKETVNSNEQQLTNQTEPSQVDELMEVYSKVITNAWLIMIGLTVIYTVVGLTFYFGGWLGNQPKTWYEWPLSFILGAMVNLFTFTLLKNNIAAFSKDSKPINSSTNYVIRLAIYAFILYISFKSDNLNAYIVATGFIVVKLAIYKYTFSKKKNR